MNQPKRHLGTLGIWLLLPLAGSQSPAPQESISFGFNAKATVMPTVQVQQVEKVLDSVPAVVAKNMTIRISGGTRSQIDLPKDWDQAVINDWVRLQKRYGFGLSYTINGNDTPKSQCGFIRRWQKAGASFRFIELMNEYYRCRAGRCSIFKNRKEARSGGLGFTPVPMNRSRGRAVCWV